jgi:hypothetical protein
VASAMRSASAGGGSWPGSFRPVVAVARRDQDRISSGFKGLRGIKSFST